MWNLVDQLFYATQKLGALMQYRGLQPTDRICTLVIIIDDRAWSLIISLIVGTLVFVRRTLPALHEQTMTDIVWVSRPQEHRSYESVNLCTSLSTGAHNGPAVQHGNDSAPNSGYRNISVHTRACFARLLRYWNQHPRSLRVRSPTWTADGRTFSALWRRGSSWEAPGERHDGDRTQASAARACNATFP